MIVASRLDEGVLRKAQAARLEEGAAPAGRVLSHPALGRPRIPPLGIMTQRVMPEESGVGPVVEQTPRRSAERRARRRYRRAGRLARRPGVPRHGTPTVRRSAPA